MSGNLAQNNASGTGINVSSCSGGTTTFSGASKSLNTGANTAVTLTSNTGHTINFTGGGLVITTTTTGFTATAGATAINVTGTGNTINSGTATALNVVSTTIGASGLTFQSISSSGGSATGIILDGTGSNGGLTVTGTGSAASGGTIATKTGADGATTTGNGIYLNNCSGISLTRMQLNGFQNFGIRGTSVTGFSLTNSVINGTSGTTEAGGSEEGPIRFDGLFTSGSFPTASISGCTIQGGFSVNIRVQNTSGTLNRLVIDNCTLGPVNSSGTSGGSSMLYDAASGATFNWTVSNSTFTGSRATMLSATAHGGSHMDAVVLQNIFQNADTHILSGAGAVLLQGGDLGLADITYNISCNRISTTAAGGAKGATINIYKATNCTGGSETGTVGNNTIGVVGTALSGVPNSAPAIWIQDHGAGTSTVLITNNTIVEYGEEAIDLQRTQGSSTLNVSVFKNTVTPNAANGFAGLVIEQGALSADSGTMNLVVGNSNAGSGQQNDFSNGDPGNFSDIEVLRAGSSTTVLNLSKNGSAAVTVTAVLQDDNTGGASTTVFIPTTGSMNLVTTLPTLPPVVANCTTP